MISLDWTLWLQAGIFVFLVIFLSKVLFKPVFQVLEAREEMHKGPAKQASALKEEAAALQEEVRASLATAKQEVETFRNEILVGARQSESEILTASKAEANGFLADSRKEIDGQIQSASDQLRQEGDRIGSLLANKILTSAGQRGAL